MKYSLYIWALLMMISCAVPRGAQDAQIVMPGSFRNDSVANGDGSIADLPWKTFLANDELAALIDTALIRNNDLQVAVKDIEAAEEVYHKARQGYLPTVGVGGSSSNSLPSKNSLNGLTADQFLGTKDLNNYDASVSISWEADIWGKVKNQRAAAQAAYLQTAEARKGIQTRLVAAVAAGYYNLLMLDRQLEIARENLALSDSTLAMVQLQYAAAQVNSLAVEQVTAQRLAAAQLLPRLEQAVGVQEDALSVLTGVMPGTIVRKGLTMIKAVDPAGDVADSLLLPGHLNAGLPAAMVSRRPDVKAQELALSAASARIGLARANFYPSLVISAEGGINSLKTSNWFNIPASLLGVVAGSLTEPVLARRELKTQYNLAVIHREQAVLGFRQSVLIAYQEVSDALIRIRTLNDEQTIALQRTRELQSAVSHAGLLFSTGSATYLDVISAQANVLAAELELASLRRNRQDAVIELYRSLGGGWQ